MNEPAPSMQCSDCDQDLLDSPGFITGAAMPTMALNPNGCPVCESWSDRIGKLKKNKLAQSTVSIAAKQQRSWSPERKAHGTTPVLILAEDEPTIGKRHGSAARSVSAKDVETRPALKSWLAPSGPFFLEIFSGPGRLAAALRMQGVTAHEFDLTEQGGHKDLLTKKVLHEIVGLINDPNCIGVWFGFPCGTFSSARRNDGGPPPLRGVNSKDIWGFPHLRGRERDRVRSANKLLFRMHHLMRIGE